MLFHSYSFLLVAICFYFYQQFYSTLKFLTYTNIHVKSPKALRLDWADVCTFNSRDVHPILFVCSVVKYVHTCSVMLWEKNGRPYSCLRSGWKTWPDCWSPASYAAGWPGWRPRRWLWQTARLPSPSAGTSAGTWTEHKAWGGAPDNTVKGTRDSEVCAECTWTQHPRWVAWNSWLRICGPVPWWSRLIAKASWSAPPPSAQKYDTKRRAYVSRKVMLINNQNAFRTTTTTTLLFERHSERWVHNHPFVLGDCAH